eukprot:10853108-Prorocentrum_lima.AAC.1
MTSSLVGSEMCIRDSSDPAPHIPASLGSSDARAVTPAEIAQEAQSCIPVSYTHLTLPTICSV